VLYLEHPSWTKEDTLSLLDAVRIFDLDWSLVASTFHGSDSRKTPTVRCPPLLHLVSLLAPPPHPSYILFLIRP
jgi:hypothetical protein